MHNDKTMRHFAYILTLLTTVLLAGCSIDEQQDGESAQELSLDISVAPWQNENLPMTRATATEEVLMASNDGFGLYCAGFHLANNTKVTWDAVNRRWYYGTPVLWKHNMDTKVNFHAYAPYDADGTFADASSFTMTSEGLTFNTTIDKNSTDLLCGRAINAQRTATNKGKITITFQHVLAKLSFGTITNNYGRTVTLQSIEVGGTFYTKRTWAMATGEWSDTGAESSEQSKTFSSLNQNIAEGATADISSTATDIMQMPGPTANITFTFSTTDFGTETATFQVLLEEGKNKILNLTITNNFEVVITD